VFHLVEEQVEHYARIVVKEPAQLTFLMGWIRRAFDTGVGL
jgi:hypothetical protein